MDIERLRELFKLYYNKTISQPERIELAELIKSSPSVQLEEIISESGETLVDFDYSVSEEKEEMILRSILNDTPIRKISWRRRGLTIAASVILIVSFGVYYFSFDAGTEKKRTVISQQKMDVHPGTFKAKLKLSDGSVIILNSASSGKLTQQNNTVIVNNNGQLIYNSKPSNNSAEEEFNTVITNRSETYSVKLADGTAVWLNAASSVKFPVEFSGKERRVEITGEVYFDVAKNAKQPFIVIANQVEVLALGTEFNVNAYADEAAVSATLIEGAVKVSALNSSTDNNQTKKSAILKPGQQAQFQKGNLTVGEVNTNSVTAWKEGLFYFENTDLDLILRQFARWYDLELIYEGPKISRKFFAIVKRSYSLLEVLAMLKDNNIKYKIEGRKVYVISK